MHISPLNRLDEERARLLEQLEQLRRLDLTVAHERQQALERSQAVLGALARFRHGLSKLEQPQVVLRAA